MGSNLAAVADLLASPSRAAMVEALLEGRTLTAGELALVAGVGPSAASEHLAVLVTGKLISVKREGRHRYYELSSPRVATALEAFSDIWPPAPIASLRQATRAQALRNARTCYDHLAGRLGVAVLDAMLAQGWLVKDSTGLKVTARGERGLRSIGVEIGPLRGQARAFARVCIDSTERRPHLGGGLGAAVTSALFQRDWIRRQSTGRGLTITPAGQAGIANAFGLSPLATDTGGSISGHSR